MCADHIQGEVLLCSCVFAVKDGWDLEEGWGRLQQQSLYCLCCSGKRDAEAWHDCFVQIWHQASIWAEQGMVNLTMVQCLIITFISLSITYC